jgi:hypothetical protein
VGDVNGWAVLIVAITGPLAAVVGPLLLARRLDRQQRRSKVEDYARQDAVIAKADAVAEQAAEAARLLLERQDAGAARQAEVAAQAAVAAELLLDANQKAAETAAATNSKLDVIHVLVNSKMTAAMRAELDATTAQLALMRRLHKLEPSPEAQAAIVATQRRVAELQTALTERLAQSEVANQQSA